MPDFIQSHSEKHQTSLDDWLAHYKFDIRMREQGKVVSVGDGIVLISGLPSAAIDEIIYLEDGSRAIVFNLTETTIGCVLIEQTPQLGAGISAHHSGISLSTPVGDNLIGRIIDPIGNVLDDGDPIPIANMHNIDVLSPQIIDRDFVNKPLYTGNKIIDNLVPIGKGQRQLIIGDNGLGKSSLALDIILNQRNKNVTCIYVLIGQNRSIVVDIIQILKNHGAMDYSIIVVAEATALPGLQYLAPFAGCTIAEDLMRKGKDTIVIYDDLTTHASIYRELSLLLRKPPGREAYPADIFYLHARLLERSTHLSSKLGGGSMTAFPIVETEEGEIATYIPTNLISITDGQIYFDAKLFSSGFLPAIDITKSVSRIGGKAQDPQIKVEAARMKLDYLQFLELEVFVHFSARLEPSMQKKIQRGNVLRELLKQDRFNAFTIEEQLGWLIAFNEGLFDTITLEKIPEYLQKLREYININQLMLKNPRKQWQAEIISWFKLENKNV